MNKWHFLWLHILQIYIAFYLWMQIKSADNRILQEQLQNKVGFRKISSLGFLSIYFLQEYVIFLFCFYYYWFIFFLNQIYLAVVLLLCAHVKLLFYWKFQCAENMELQEKITRLEQQLASVTSEKVSPPPTPIPQQSIQDEYVDDLRRKIQSQVSPEALMFESQRIEYICIYIDVHWYLLACSSIFSWLWLYLMNGLINYDS